MNARVKTQPPPVFRGVDDNGNTFVINLGHVVSISRSGKSYVVAVAGGTFVIVGREVPVGLIEAFIQFRNSIGGEVLE